MMGVSSISLSWSVAGDTVVDSEVVWLSVVLLETEVSVAPSHPPATPYLTSRNSLSTVSQLLSAHRLQAISVTLSLPSQVIAFFSLILKVFLSIQFLHVKAVDHHHQ